jgi:hypothetical protein
MSLGNREYKSLLSKNVVVRINIAKTMLLIATMRIVDVYAFVVKT